MHEYSIVQALLQSCKEHAEANNAKKVTKVLLKVGVMSGVEPELLVRAFDIFKEEGVCNDAQLVLQVQKVVVMCRTCQEESSLEKLEYLCPKCKSNALDILDGEDMYLLELELEENL